MRKFLFVLALLMLLPVLSAAEVIENFNSQIDNWTPVMQYGDISRCKTSLGEGEDGSKALKIDIDFGSTGVNHIIYQTAFKADLSQSAGLTFDVKGTGSKVNIFLFIWDSKGAYAAYGPHGTNKDFFSDYADWHTCKLTFETDKPVEGGNLDLSSIAAIGFMLNQSGVCKGTVSFDNLSLVGGRGYINVPVSEFSPNGDGFRDTTEINGYAPADATVTLDVLNAKGKKVTSLTPALTPQNRRIHVMWDGKADGKVLANGRYKIKATFTGSQKTESVADLRINSFRKWSEIDYKVEPFFPIGVWFEGSPNAADYPSDPAGAKKYYDRCFKDIADHGFNTVTVPNCPQSLWNTLLQSAQDHGLKVILEIYPVAKYIVASPVEESKVYEAAQQVYDQIGKYKSLIRYQIRDEPPPSLIPNWLLAQRILAAVDPTRPAFSTCSGGDSLSALTINTKLSEAVWDCYPHLESTPSQTLGWFPDAVFNGWTPAARGNTMWAVLQSFAKPGTWRYPTPEELRDVTYLSLAAGCKGVFYFLYQSMPKHAENLKGLIDVDGKPLPMYATATTLAKELNALSPFLLTLKPGDFKATVKADAKVGCFNDDKGRNVMILASLRPDKAVDAELKDVPQEVWTDYLTGETFYTQTGDITIPLRPGSGRVLVKQ